MPVEDAFLELLDLPREELEQRVALLYEQGLIDLQERMHPGSVRRLSSPGIVIHGAPSEPPRPGQHESPTELAEHGRTVLRAMMEPVRERLCTELRREPRAFSRPETALPRIMGHLTRVSPPDLLFVAAACLVWKEGLESFCGSGAEADA